MNKGLKHWAECRGVCIKIECLRGHLTKGGGNACVGEMIFGLFNIALGPSGTGKTHIALGLGLAACQKGLTVRFISASSLVHELMEARNEKRLLKLQKSLAKVSFLIIDELGFVPLSKTGAELLFELISSTLRMRLNPYHQ